MGDNLWTTDRTFAERAQRPVYENRVHLFDKDSTGSYTLVFEATSLNAVAAQQIGQPVPINRTVALDSVDVQFTRNINPASLTAEDFTLTRNGTLVPISGTLTATAQGGGRYTVIGLGSSTAAFGDYELTLQGSGVTDEFGTAGAVGTVSTVWTMGERSPFVSIVRGVTPNSTINRPVDHLEFQFSFPVNPTTFTVADLSLSRNGGENLLLSSNGVSIRQLSDTRFRVEGLSSLTTSSGGYRFEVFAIGVTSPGGTAGSSNYDLAWTNDVAAPLAAINVRFAPDRGISNTDRRINDTVGTILGTLPDLNGTVTVYNLTTNRELGTATVIGDQFEAPVDLLVPGAHLIRVRVTDAAGNTADTTLNLFVDLTPPSIEKFSGQPLQPREQPIGDVFVHFTETIDPTGFTVADLSLTRNGGPNRIPGSGVSIRSTAIATQYIISGLGTLANEPGVYELLVNLPGIIDEFGNTGTANVSWALRGVSTTSDTVPPVSRVSALPTQSDQQFVVNWSGTDDTGITGYDIFVSVNGAAYTSWFTKTSLTSSVYSAGAGQSLRFYSMARDAAGNVEAIPGDPDAITTTFTPGSISGTLFHDRNADGQRQTNEEGLSGWTVFLDTDADGTLDTDERREVTTNTGTYSFAQLRPGTYTVAQVAPNGWQTLAAVTTTGSNAPVQVNAEVAAVNIGDNRAANLIGLDRLYSDDRLNDFTGRGVTIAVLDSGFTADSRFFDANVIAYQYDFVDNDSDASDPNGHGTAVAGMIAGTGNGVNGVSPGTRLVVLRVLDSRGRGDFARIEQALQWVLANADTFQIAAVNLSFADAAGYGVTAGRYGIGDELAALATRGIIAVAAAGNAHATVDGIAYPAADPNVIAVGAVYSGDTGSIQWRSGASDSSTAADRIVSFSQRGLSTDQVFAPGAFLTTSGISGLTTYSGTSLAAPQVAGLVALAQQAAREQLGRSLTLAEFRSILARTGQVIVDGDDEQDNVSNTGLAYRRINAAEVVEAVLNLTVVPATTTPTPIPTVAVAPTPSAEPVAAASSRQVVVQPGQAVTNIDQGFFRVATVDVSIYSDANGDGQRSEGEGGRPDVIAFLDTDGDGIRDTGERFITTNATGVASFDNLTPGEYRIGVELPNGQRLTQSVSSIRLNSGETASFGNVGLAPVADITPPTLTGTKIQNGETQRNRVNRMSWTFSESVNIPALIANGQITRAFKLVSFGTTAGSGGEVVVLNASQFQYDAISNTLTWSLDSFANGTPSLQDGYYQWQLYSNLVTDLAGNPMQGDAIVRTDLHRLAGDVTGQARVDDNSQQAVNNAIGTRSNMPNWDPSLDVDGDGIITARDRLAIARAKGNRLPARS